MTQQKVSKRRRQVLMMGAGAVAAPAMAMPVAEGTWSPSSAGAVVSGRVVSAADGAPLAGARIDIWNDATQVSATTDFDGRYFVSVDAGEAKLNYRVTHQGHTTQITQLRLAGTRQRRVARVRDEAGVTRAACELVLSRPLGVASLSPEAVTL